MRRKIIAALPCGTRGRTALLSCKPEPEKELRYPMYYLFAGGLQPQSVPPADGRGVLAILTPQEAHSAALPTGLSVPAAPADPHESQFCWLHIDRTGVTGHLRTPPRPNQPAHRLGFAWADGGLLVVDHDKAAADCAARLTEQGAPLPDGPDSFLVALLLYLIRDDLPYIQQRETRLTDLEQAVLDNDTGRFLHRMSVIRKELNRTNRYYAQLCDFASTLLEDAEEQLSGHSKKRLNHFLRKVENLRGETRMLHEYATQISSEYQAQVDIDQNRVMKVLTIVTAIFLPLTLIAGWYGMNFPNILLLGWRYGYAAVAIVSALVVVLLIWYFKRKKWF